MGVVSKGGASWRVLQLDGDEGPETNLLSDSVKFNFALTWLRQIADGGFPSSVNGATAASARAEGAPLCSWNHSVCIPTPHPEVFLDQYYLMAKWTCSLTSATRNIYLQKRHLLHTQLPRSQEKIHPVGEILWQQAGPMSQADHPGQSSSPQHSQIPTDHLWERWLKCFWSLCEIWLRPGHCAQCCWDTPAYSQSSPREKEIYPHLGLLLA